MAGVVFCETVLTLLLVSGITSSSSPGGELESFETIPYG